MSFAIYNVSQSLLQSHIDILRHHNLPVTTMSIPGTNVLLRIVQDEAAMPGPVPTTAMPMNGNGMENNARGADYKFAVPLKKPRLSEDLQAVAQDEEDNNSTTSSLLMRIHEAVGASRSDLSDEQPLYGAVKSEGGSSTDSHDNPLQYFLEEQRPSNATKANMIAFRWATNFKQDGQMPPGHDFSPPLPDLYYQAPHMPAPISRDDVYNKYMEIQRHKARKNSANNRLVSMVKAILVLTLNDEQLFTISPARNPYGKSKLYKSPFPDDLAAFMMRFLLEMHQFDWADFQPAFQGLIFTAANVRRQPEEVAIFMKTFLVTVMDTIRDFPRWIQGHTNLLLPRQTMSTMSLQAMAE